MKFFNYLLLERNIVNTEDIDLFLRSVTTDIPRMNAEVHKKIVKWVASNLKNYLLRDYEDTRKYQLAYSQSVINFHMKEKPWMQKAIDRGEELLFINLHTIGFQSQIQHVIDYFVANPDIDVSRISVPDAIRQSEQWNEDIGKQAERSEDPEGVKEVRKYPDGFHWVKITSEQAARREGILMKHSILASCWPGIKSGQKAAYSLRDKDNGPHCTIELTSDEIKQIKGKANSPVKEEYVSYVKDFLTKPITGEKYTKVKDLNNIGLMEIEGQIYDLYRLPKNMNIKGDLDLEDCTSLTTLPSGLKVGRSLYLRGCTSLKTLPDDLKVKGKIYVSDNMKKYFVNSKFKDKIV